MKNKQNIGIFGLSRTGLATIAALKDIARIICYDDRKEIREAFASKYGTAHLVDLDDHKWHNLDKIILSPGVPLEHKIFNLALEHNTKIVSDIEMIPLLQPEARLVAVTGTNGKSTTTALIEHILQKAGFDYQARGNIGLAALSLPLNKAGYILEISSFQFDLMSELAIDIAVLLNITPDHLDRHKTMQNYIAAKEKIITYLKPDGYAIINVDNEITADIFARYKTLKSLIPISTRTIHKKGVTVTAEEIIDNIDGLVRIELPKNIALQGEHNRENIAGCYGACRMLGVKPELIVEGIGTFKGLPHRMQYIGSIGSINFYNDSKATNSDSAGKSIASLDNVYWLAGGIVKEQAMPVLEPLFPKIKRAFLFGKDKEILASFLKNKVEFSLYEDLQKALPAAYKYAKMEPSLGIKNILLAPAASSLDQFEDFERRGLMFINLCRNELGVRMP